MGSNWQSSAVKGSHPQQRAVIRSQEQLSAVKGSHFLQLQLWESRVKGINLQPFTVKGSQQ